MLKRYFIRIIVDDVLVVDAETAEQAYRDVTASGISYDLDIINVEDFDGNSYDNFD